MREIDIHIAVRKLTAKAPDHKTPVIDLLERQTKEPWKILVATILSARTTDQTTAAAIGRLFAKAATIDDLGRLPLEKIEKLIHPVGFFRNKAKYLQKLPGELDRLYAGRIPETVEELVKLPGVGRKTANLVVAVAFHRDAICVDTHVHRIMNIWKYVETTTPLATEMTLREKLPPQYWQQINTLLVAHGQSVCRPISPHCDQCVLENECPKFGIKGKVAPKGDRVGNQRAYNFISWNVNGIRAVQKKGFIEQVKSLDAHIYAVQETKAMPEQLDEELLNIDGYQSYWHSAEKKGYSGVAIYTKLKPLQVIKGVGKQEFDREGRVLTLEFDNFFLVNCYYPNSQHELKRLDYKLDFNRTVATFCRKLRKTKSVVICGDLNVAHKPIDLRNPKANEMNAGYTREERKSMDRFLQSGFLDTFRLFNQEPDNYTWWSYRFNARARNIGWRIDYFCIDRDSESRALDARIYQEINGSDHCPIGLTFKKTP